MSGDCDCDEAEEAQIPAAERAATRWQLARRRRTHPCGCVTVHDTAGRVQWAPYTCEAHRLFAPGVVGTTPSTAKPPVS